MVPELVKLISAAELSLTNYPAAGVSFKELYNQLELPKCHSTYDTLFLNVVRTLMTLLRPVLNVINMSVRKYLRKKSY